MCPSTYQILLVLNLVNHIGLKWYKIYNTGKWVRLCFTRRLLNMGKLYKIRCNRTGHPVSLDYNRTAMIPSQLQQVLGRNKDSTLAPTSSPRIASVSRLGGCLWLPSGCQTFLWWSQARISLAKDRRERDDDDDDDDGCVLLTRSSGLGLAACQLLQLIQPLLKNKLGCAIYMGKVTALGKLY